MIRYLLIFIIVLQVNICRAGIFDSIKSLAESKRVLWAEDIYDSKLKLNDSVFTITSLNQLLEISGDLKDRSLTCFAISLQADYYARIRGLNSYSTQLHLDAIKMADEYGLLVMKNICTYRMGRYYYNFKNYPVAFEYLLRADNYFKEFRQQDVPHGAERLFFMGGIYYETGNYTTAETYFQQILELPSIDRYIHKQTLNTLALINRQQKDTLRALDYFQKTLAVSIAQQDSVWIGISYSNIATIYLAQLNYDKALDLLQKGYRLSEKYKEWSHAFMDLLYIAQILILRTDLADAEKNIRSAMALQPVYNALAGKKLLYETWIQYYEAKKSFEPAIQMAKQLMLVKDSIAINNNQQAYREVQLRIETEKHLNTIGKLEAEKRADTLKRNSIIAGLVLLMIVGLLWYRNYRMKVKNNAAILQADKLRAEEKLKYARQMLLNFTENTRQKNDLIIQFSAELERLKASLPGQPAYEERMSNVEALMQSSILSNEEWASFRELFDKVHKGFFQRLEEKYPGLSLEETRLVSLIRLGISEQEIANMMGMQLGVILAAREKLFSKLGLTGDAVLAI